MKRTCLAVILVIGFVTIASAADPSLVGWWKLDAGSGTTAIDSSRNLHNGTMSGNPIWVPGRIEWGLNFDGIDDFVETPFTHDLSQWTVSVWVKSPDVPSDQPCNGPVHRGKNFQINWDHKDPAYRGAAVITVGGILYPASFGTLTANTWYHLTATYDGENLKAYKDGILITTNKAPSGQADSETNTLKFGRHTVDPQYFAGTIDDIRVYNRALSSEEILELSIVFYGGGSGTTEDPYQIWTPEQMNTIGANPSDWDKHFKLLFDIDMLSCSCSWNIIGNTTKPFTGTFDGDGHLISRLHILESDQEKTGIFGIISGATICNLGIVNSSFSSEITSGDREVGGLVGENQSGTIRSCYVSGSSSGYGTIGGLVGYNKGIITSCYSAGFVNGYGYLGGLVGSNEGTITACYSIGKGNDITGGLVGQNLGTISSCFWDIQTSGQYHSSGGKGLTTEQMKTLLIYQNAGWGDKGWVIKDGVDYPRLSWEILGGIPIPTPQAIPLVGNGTAETPYLISTAVEFALLSWYSDVLDKQIRLTANLDLNGLTLYPIGDLGSFTGIFDGNGHMIHNAIIHQPDSACVGLFSCIGSNGQIRNLGVEQMNIIGGEAVGGLVGSCSGTITSCYSTGSVRGSYKVGGLVGYNDGTIVSCHAIGFTGLYDSISSCIGGLVGYSCGTITSCYANSSINGDSNVGGLVGENELGTIMYCYVTGPIRGSDDAGGLVGHNQSGTIRACYAAGSCFVPTVPFSLACGLIGRNDSGTITSCFWDIDSSAKDIGISGDPGDVTGKITAEMQKQSTFTSAGWDFTNVWDIVENQTYPFFRKYWTADLNHDGIVNLTDFGIFASQWLKQ
jgi:hypothetical protein